MSKPNPPLPPAEKTLIADPDFFTLRGPCQRMFGRHFHGACQMDISLSHTGMTALAMMGEPGNLYVEFTPDGLRQMASHLLDAAAKAEAIGAEHARTQLAAALAKKGGQA
jgi:hypothetical protein